MLKMRAHKDYICEVMEEIIEYNEKEKKVVGVVAIVECAKNDLNKLLDIWIDKEKSKFLNEYFAEEKLAFFCLKAMEALSYLHSKKIYFGDMKPENLLIFRNYKVKLGDMGISVKIPDAPEDDEEEMTIKIKGVTRLYSLPEI